jgi:TPR repeat protein
MSLASTRTDPKSATTQEAVPSASGAAHQQASAAQGTATAAAAHNGLQTAPLSAVVTDAVKRWFQETNKEAMKGDIKQQALLGQMLMEGYGCQANPASGRMWSEKAQRRGYRMSGVYCEL